MGNDKMNKDQFNQNQQNQQGGNKKAGVGQQPSTQKDIGKQGNTTSKPNSNPNVRK